MRCLKILMMMMVCFLLFCSQKSALDVSENPELRAEAVRIDQSGAEESEEFTTDHISPTIAGEDRDSAFFAPIRERILGSSVEDGYNVQPMKGDTLANYVWALYGKGPNVTRIMRIVSDNEHITDPNLVSLRYPVKIFKEE